MYNRIHQLKMHIHHHRAKYAAAGTATAFLLLMHRNGKEIEAFLVEKGIDPAEYWCPEAYFEELAN